METGIKPEYAKALSEVEKSWESLKLTMTAVEFEKYIHEVEKEDFMSVSDSKRLFFQWIKERKQ